jgi:hypothetical protein
MNTCAGCGSNLSWWNRDLGSGLCAACARKTAKERKEREKLEASMAATANEEELKHKLEKLQAQGSLSNEELAQLRGALHEGKAAPRKMFWLRILLAGMCISGAAKSCQLMKENERRQQVQQQQQAPRKFGRAQAAPAGQFAPGERGRAGNVLAPMEQAAPAGQFAPGEPVEWHPDAQGRARVGPPQQP